jgi:hypothetical protein
VGAQYWAFSTSINRGEGEALLMAFFKDEALCTRVRSLRRRMLWKFVSMVYFVHDIMGVLSEV